MAATRSRVTPITTASPTASLPTSPVATDRRTWQTGERLVPIPLAAMGLPEWGGEREGTRMVVNRANVGEMKMACDDAVRGIMKDHQFTEIHTHTDIKLALGWLAVLVAAGTAGWSYRYGFEQTKGITMAGVVAYFVLSGIQLLYAYYFEGSKIYTGKRKSLSKRIETELIRISSRTIPHAPSSTPGTSTRPAAHPRYLLDIAYRRSANANKSLLRRTRVLVDASYGELVDEQGGVEPERLGALMDRIFEMGGEAEWKDGAPRRG